MDSKYVFYVEPNCYGMPRALHLLYEDLFKNKTLYHTVEDGKLISHELKVGVKPSIPLIEFSGYGDHNEMLKAISEGLKRAGIVPEVDNKERITAEALAEERSKELSYFKNLNAKLIETFIPKMDKSE